MQYIEIMQGLQLELAAEYLLMAAMLAEIKSRLLLPKLPEVETGEEQDPRAELVRKLQEYERYQQAAINLDVLPRINRDFYPMDVEVISTVSEVVRPEISLSDLLQALQAVLERAKLYTEHHVLPEILSIRERMTLILAELENQQFLEFTRFFRAKEGKMGVVVTLIAMLELIRQSTLELIQNHPFAPIYVRLKASSE
jgi:segregation and condensation protein A